MTYIKNYVILSSSDTMHFGNGKSSLALSLNTQNRENCGWIHHGIHWTLCYWSKFSTTLKSKDLATCGFQKKFLTHLPKTTEAELSFRKVSLPPAKHMLFLWVREFWPQIYSLIIHERNYAITSAVLPTLISFNKDGVAKYLWALHSIHELYPQYPVEATPILRQKKNTIGPIFYLIPI